MKPNSIRACSQSASVLAMVLAASLVAPAQLTPQTDPANLAGERVSPPALADTLPINHGSLALEQLLRKLRTRASFMLIVAHPDDEDGGMLCYLSRGQGARVAMLTLNRGEGGQNLMSADFEDALGLIRTQELLAADRYMAVDQLFGTEVDFGFSKTKEEAFAKWTHQRVLYDAVRAVRLYRPLVVASVFIGAPSDGHGQHQVAGEIAQEVFKAAGDPSVFPEMGLPPWQPLKVYARVPFARIDAQGMFDYATNQYTPARFTNYVTGKVTTTVPKANVVVPEGTPDPLLGNLTYVQFARQGLALQKTQIGRGVRLAPAGKFDVSYHRYGSCVTPESGCPIHHDPATSGSPGESQTAAQQTDSGADLETVESGFFEGIDTSLPGMATLVPEASDKFRPFLEKLDQQIAEAQRLFSPAHPQLTAPPLRLALQGLNSFIGELENAGINDLPQDESYNLLHELRIKRVQLNDALLLADGITLQATFVPQGGSTSLLTTAQRVDVKTDLSTGSDPTELKSIDLNFLGDSIKTRPAPGSTGKMRVPAPLPARDIRKETLRALVDQDLPPTRPYFSRPNIEQPFYDISNPALRNAPSTPPPLTATVTLNDHGVPLTIEATVAEPAEPAESSGSAASPLQPTVVVPPVSVSLPVAAAVIPLQNHTFPLSYSATNPEPEAAPQFHLELPPLWSYTVPGAANPVPPPPPAGRVSRQTAIVHTSDPEPYRAYPITVITQIHDRTYSEGFRSVGYPGLEHTNLYTPTIFHVTAVDLQTAPGLNIAYLPGTGDDVPAALEDLGVHPHLITAADLVPDSLKAYDAVVLGVRAYEAHPELAAANSALNTYAANGGIVIAQYNTGRLPEHTGPYPLSLGDGEKVVEEDARVRILYPAYPLLSWPNQITPADFNNWVEERGHGFMGKWDSHYTALLETHDAGQQPQRGGLLVARTGKGAWIYLGLALYRQFPEGVPGPYRLLANLISASRNPGFQK
jgi:LmbE family N-acetylglucosaminyl deacetylase